MYLLWAVLMMGVSGLMAENVIQVQPFTTKPGVTATDKATMYMEMTNEEANIIGFQFDILLPEGMTLGAIGLVKTRFPYEIDDFTEEKTYSHSVSYESQSDGYTRVIVSSTQLEPITGTSGVVLQARYTTDGTMAEGTYPIVIKNAVLGISSTQKAETAEVAVSYVTVTSDGTAMQEADVDLSDFEGYMPSFVVSQLNSDLAADSKLRWLNIPEAMELGGEIAVPDNVLYSVNGEVGLKRTFPSGQRSTVCLPFSLSASQVRAIKDLGCKIEGFAGYQPSKSSVWFESVTVMMADKPYVVTVTGSEDVALFDNLSDVTMVKPEDAGSVTWSDMSFLGSYTEKTLSSTYNHTYYAYDAADGVFVRIGSNAKVYPYRAYMLLEDDGYGSARVLTISDGYQEDEKPEEPGEEEQPTAIDNVNGNVNDNGVFYDLSGRRVSQPSKGLYIRNGRKFIKK